LASTSAVYSCMFLSSSTPRGQRCMFMSMAYQYQGMTGLACPCGPRMSPCVVCWVGCCDFQYIDISGPLLTSTRFVYIAAAICVCSVWWCMVCVVYGGVVPKCASSDAC
jgi:hypothetical protein